MPMKIYVDNNEKNCIDEDGRVLKAVTEKIDRELPILEGLAVKKSTTGEVIEFQEKVESKNKYKVIDINKQVLDVIG